MEMAGLFEASAGQLQAFEHYLAQAGFTREHLRCVLRNPERVKELVNVASQWLPNFLSLEEQLEGFLLFNAWLSTEFPAYQIPTGKIQEFKKKIPVSMPAMEGYPLLFFGFGDNGRGEADAVLSGRLAWLYLCSKAEARGFTIGHSKYIRFDKPESFRLRAEASPRPRGFYVKRLPKEDFEAVGMRYKGVSVLEVRQQLGGKWGMALEGLQFLAVTHPHYLEKMNGKDIPFICLSDYEVALNNDVIVIEEDNEFTCVPSIAFEAKKRKVTIEPFEMKVCDFSYGSGFFE